MHLSPSIVSIVTKNNQRVIRKEVQKKMLFTKYQNEQAKIECIIHSHLKCHDNVVKLYEYTETDDSYVMFMEYCNDADYLDNKIINCKAEISDE